jgi:RHS repeat-associated protein
MAAVLALLPAAPLAAQSGNCGVCGSAFSLPAFMCTIPGTLTTASNTCPAGSPKPAGTLCNYPLNTTYNQIPKVTGPTLVPVPLGNGQYKVRLVVHVETPFNSTAGNGALQVFWNSGATATSPTIDLCTQGATDVSDTYLEFGTFTCANVPQTVGTYSLRAQMAQGTAGSCCTPRSDLNGMTVTVTPQLLGCPVPRKWPCDDCKNRKGSGQGASSPAGKGGTADPADSGPGAMLHYAAGGAGGPGFPGTTAWNAILGRYWAHDYAQRIVLDPALNNDTHVWLIAPDATFREFTNLSGGIYQTVSPSDEYRKLYRTASGWDLHELNGTVHSFDGSGLWTQTIDRNGNAKVAAYTGGRLSSVAFPDGRNEIFTYNAAGKLATITETGVGGAASRTWAYTWTGNDLTRIDRPDGTAWEFFYTDAANPGWLTRMDLVGTDASRRVDTAWAYDSRGNTVKLWRGDPSFTGANAVEKWSFSYDDPVLPVTTLMTDPLGQVATFTIGRDTVSDKPRVASVAGDCPNCGSGANVQLFYEDAANPLRPTRKIDARGTTTVFTYDANGVMTSKTEAVGTPLERVATWEYNGPFPALATRTDVPSTSGTGTRSTVFSYDSSGNVTSRTLTGIEAGSAFSYATNLSYNTAGQAVLVDPPGYASQDQISLTYDPARGNLLPLTRTDPLIGTTSYAYDPYNRLVEMTDPNGETRETAYDALNRPLSVTQRGATPAEDLVTFNVYNAFGDLQRTVMPRGNVVEYGYDAAGRLVTIESKPDAATPGERTVYTLDAAGNRTREEKQRWTGAAWATDSADDYVYSTRCLLDKIIHADGSVKEFAYDCEGNLEKVWDELHPRASNSPTELRTYDVLNRLTSISRPWSGGGQAITSYAYDVQDHVSRVADANGTVTDAVYSDRDLKTRETSEVSGTVNLTYNEHGQMVSRTDARNVTLQRTLDALDRVTFADYPDNTLDTAYTYDDPAVPFSKGRLTALARGGRTVAYSYDRFGRILQDGALVFAYDANANVQSVSYPGGITATYTYDFADRPASLSFQDGAGPVQPLVSGGTYMASGPLTGLTLGNGLAETRPYTNRVFPSRIAVPGRLDWTYTNDAAGNVTSITDNLSSGGSRSFAYQDGLYFLTQGNGPWGVRSWAYDKAGNRISETRDGVTDTYAYTPNGAGGSSPRLAQVTLGAGGAEQLSYDAGGGMTFRSGPQDKLRLSYDDEEFLAQLRNDSGNASQGIAQLGYDGRGLLASYTFSSSPTATPERVGASTFSSEGLLYHRSDLVRRGPSSPRNQPQVQSDAYLFYFGDRPIAIYEKTVTTPTSGSLTTATNLLYLTTDPAGAPILATGTSGNLVWQGGFEPFGDDWNGAQAAGVFLRLPGQWNDATWSNSSLPSRLVQNVFRWYEPQRGRYDMADPLEALLSQRSRAMPAPSLEGLPSLNPFGYVDNRPLTETDPLGLITRDCGNGCTIRIERDPAKGLHVNWTCKGGLRGCIKADGTTCDEGTSYVPPRRIIDCIKKHDPRFNLRNRVDFKCPDLPKFEIKPQYLPPLIIGGAILTCILCPECCPLVAPAFL